MAWTNQTFSVGQVLTAAQMTNLNNNDTALANGDSGAPRIQPVAIKNTAAGDFIVATAPIDKTTLSSSYVRLKEIKIPLAGVLRVVFTMGAGGGPSDVRCTIYVNGLSVGTERQVTGGGTAEFTEDISSLTPGDLVQVFGRVASGGFVCVVSEFTVRELDPVLNYSIVL